jgi:erythromycin esterase-like protein
MHLNKTKTYVPDKKHVQSKKITAGSLIRSAIQKHKLSAEFVRQTEKEYLYLVRDEQNPEEFQSQVAALKDQYNLKMHASSSDSYPFEDAINQKLNLQFGNLVELYKTQRLELFG